MKNGLITIDEAFSGKNWEIIKFQLETLNEKGIYDAKFLLDAEPYVTSRESWDNFLLELPELNSDSSLMFQ